jgi:RHS repeat-associated protein
VNGLDRLTAANGIWGSGSFGYDALDNLRTSVVGSRSAVASIDGANRLSALTVNGAAQNYGYDANGNLTLRGSQGFTFDIGNRLASAAGKASYAYDGHGRRTYVAYTDGSWKVQVYGQAGKLLWSQHSSQGATRHVYLGDRLIAEVGSTGVSYSHTDALGSPVARTNASAQVTSRTRYEPYGATAAGTNPTGIGFTGHVNDADTGLVYMQQRYYEPVAGRFLSVDPVTTSTKDGEGFNRFAYANNNPYKYVDPDGRWGVAGAIYGAIAGGTGGFVSSGSSFREKAVGVVTGALAGGAVGFVAPQTSHFVGLATASAVASAAGQASGSASNAAIDKGVGNVSMSDVKVDATTTALGALGGGVGGQVGKGISQLTSRPIIGQTLEKGGTPTTAGLVTGSVVEGAIIGGAEKSTQAVKDTAQKVKEAVSN